MALYWPQRLEKGYHRGIWEANLEPLGPMFQHLLISSRQCSCSSIFITNLGPNNKSKMLKVGPKFFQP